MRFAVPQFIDVEDKIFGPLTLKQAVYMGGGVGIVLALFTQLGIVATLLFGVPILLLSAALAFVKINKRPFYLMVYAAVFYAIRNKLYLWKRTTKKKSATATAQQTKPEEEPTAPTLTQSRLKELAWSLDTRDSMYTNEEQWK